MVLILGAVCRPHSVLYSSAALVSLTHSERTFTHKFSLRSSAGWTSRELLALEIPRKLFLSQRSPSDAQASSGAKALKKLNLLENDEDVKMNSFELKSHHHHNDQRHFHYISAVPCATRINNRCACAERRKSIGPHRRYLSNLAALPFCGSPGPPLCIALSHPTLTSTDGSCQDGQNPPPQHPSNTPFLARRTAIL